MTDPLDSLAHSLQHLFGQDHKVIVSDAPGGPESEGEDHRLLVQGNHRGVLPLGYLAAHPGLGHDATGFGGSGDAIVVEQNFNTDVASAIEEAEHIFQVRHKTRDVKAEGKVRLNTWFWPEAHSAQSVGVVMGPFSLFDGTTGVPGAGNSVQVVPIALPAGTVSPIFLLDRYPGALSMCIFVGAFSICPLGTTATGNYECWFSDPGGATVGLGTYFANAGSGYQSITRQLSTPLTDPGQMTMGQLIINNIGLGGTEVAYRWQLALGYIANLPDPWFNEQVIKPPLPSEVAARLRSINAGG